MPLLISIRGYQLSSPGDTIHGGLLGANNFNVASGTTVFTANGISATVSFGTGGDGSTLERCPIARCTWNGNFQPGDELLTDLNFNTGGDSGRVTLDFSKGIAGIDFKLKPYAAPASPCVLTFATEIAAYDGSALLGTFHFPDGMEQSHADGNTAGFYGVMDSTGPDITSIQVLAYNCGGVGFDLCGGFATALLEGSVFPPAPEPSSLALLGSGVAIVSFLRRKAAARN
jgi:hypothetical protein